MTSSTPRPRGLTAIITYKLVKAPLMLALALWLTLGPGSAVHTVHAIARDLSEGGVLLGQLSNWIERHLTPSVVSGGTALAWLDGTSTAIEGLLLLQGRPWGEWVVVATLAILVPFEALALARHPSVFKLLVLSVNVLIVAYLVFLRLGARARSQA